MIDLKTAYGTKFKIFDDGTDDPNRTERVSCQEIVGSKGRIYTYSPKWLAVVVTSSRLVNRLNAMGLVTVQRGDDEAAFLFDSKIIDTISLMIGARKRRQLAPEQRDKLLKRFQGRKDRPDSHDSKPVLSPEEAPSRALGATEGGFLGPRQAEQHSASILKDTGLLNRGSTRARRDD